MEETNNHASGCGAFPTCYFFKTLRTTTSMFVEEGEPSMNYLLVAREGPRFRGYS